MTTDTPDRLAQGYGVAARLFGNSPVIPQFETPGEVAEDWTQFSISTVLGEVWSRPELELPERAAIAIAALTALNRPAQLRAYILGALSLGVSREHICEVIFQIAVYAGFPAAIDAFSVAKAVFDEVDAARAS
ncbi:carboxymuconolactone decarboxylase family protein [Sporichthya polymorpha]|uniref:carboxymuconolactone decarboxylase family protein n=1 Tax=Sporichthya polymorpha TaxID=35751 RepID=UPI00035D7397|nr:carboxymuconolactone decarboxylase family protein [Sporichthya polymorpha]